MIPVETIGLSAATLLVLAGLADAESAVQLFTRTPPHPAGTASAATGTWRRAPGR